MKSPKELLVPILFLVVGVFWLGIVAAGGALVLLLAALAFIVSGLLLVATPSNWAARPTAGASALLGLTLTVYQVYVASTLFGTGLGSLGLTTGAIFAVFAVLCAYLELATLSMGSKTAGGK